jgi:hypothetical protein
VAVEAQDVVVTSTVPPAMGFPSQRNVTDGGHGPPVGSTYQYAASTLLAARPWSDPSSIQPPDHEGGGSARTSGDRLVETKASRTAATRKARTGWTERDARRLGSRSRALIESVPSLAPSRIAAAAERSRTFGVTAGTQCWRASGGCQDTFRWCRGSTPGADEPAALARPWASFRRPPSRAPGPAAADGAPPR